MPSGKIVIVVVPTTKVSDIDQSQLSEFGCEVIATSRSFLQVVAPISQLHALAGLNGVRFIRAPIRPHGSSTTSQGVALAGADTHHRNGVTGAGVRVAIIDSGFEGIDQAAQAGDLPTRWRWWDFTGDGFEMNGVHGTGVAEIVYDMAPDAELYYYNVDSVVDFENAVDAAIANGIDVVNCSLQWFGTGFGDGNGGGTHCE